VVEEARERTMRVNVVSVKDKREGHVTHGHSAEGREGTVSIFGNNMIIETIEGTLRTSTVLKITIETRNSIYELENTEA
jgi:hypothetical protein